MSNGLSGMTQFIGNYAQDHRDNAMESRRVAYITYTNDYIEKTSKRDVPVQAARLKMQSILSSSPGQHRELKKRGNVTTAEE